MGPIWAIPMGGSDGYATDTRAFPTGHLQVGRRQRIQRTLGTLEQPEVPTISGFLHHLFLMKSFVVGFPRPKKSAPDPNLCDFVALSSWTKAASASFFSR